MRLSLEAVCADISTAASPEEGPEVITAGKLRSDHLEIQAETTLARDHISL